MVSVEYDFGEFEVNIPDLIVESIQKVVELILSKEKITGNIEISISFVNDDAIKQLNREYRDKDCVTDVLSFPMLENYEIKMLKNNSNTPMDILLGDIIISYPTAVKQADEYNHSLMRELCFLVCHSMLHLIGYNHIQASEREVMEAKQRVIMAELEILR